MRYLIISDMHGNWEALAAVLALAPTERYDEVLVLGDLVGYGASPNEIVEAVRGLACPAHVVRGNHDKVAGELDSGEQFNPTALVAAQWTTSELTAENLEYVRSLPVGPREVEPDLAICHGSPLDEDVYVVSAVEAEEIFSQHQASVTFFGHTHVPSIFALHGRRIEVAALSGKTVAFELEADGRYLVNPGSVGQPRDRDWRASYMLYDSESRWVELERVEYDVAAAQRRIIEANLPPILAQRLALGV